MNTTKWIPFRRENIFRSSQEIPVIHETQKSINTSAEDRHCTYHETDKSSPLPKKILL